MFYSHYDLVQQIADFLKFHDFEEIEVKVRLTNGEEIKFELTRAEDDWEEEVQELEELQELEEEELENEIKPFGIDENDWGEEEHGWRNAKDCEREPGCQKPPETDQEDED